MESTPERAAVMKEWASQLRGHAEQGVPPEQFLGAGGAAGREFAPLLVLATAPKVRDRSFRQGLVLCMADGSDCTALLYWRGHVFGVYRHVLDNRDVADVMHDLKEFRLGWLPKETVKAAGGVGTAFASLPPEAEGFPVTWFTGPDRQKFAGLGKISDHA